MINKDIKSSDSNVSKNALDEILQGKIKQTPKWYFTLKNTILWFVGILCIVAGALTVSLIIFTFINSALFMHNTPQISFVRHLTIILPLLWIILTIVFIVLFDILVRCTKHGYKYSLMFLVIINIILSIIIGIAFYFCGISNFVDDVLGNFQHYHNVERRQAQIFDVPDKGVIVGRIIKCDDEYFTLLTPHGNKWHVIHKNISKFQNSDIVDGQILMVFGKKIDEDIFVACKINEHCMHGENSSVRSKHVNKIQRKYNGKIQLCEHDKISEHIKQKVQSACLRE